MTQRNYFYLELLLWVSVPLQGLTCPPEITDLLDAELDFLFVFAPGCLLLGGGGLDDHDFLNICPTSGCHGQIVKQFLTMTMAKISKFPWSNGQNWSILKIDHGQNRGCHGHGQFFLPLTMG